jgi:hypothetical protein
MVIMIKKMMMMVIIIMMIIIGVIYRDLTRSSKHPLGGNAYLTLDNTDEPYQGISNIMYHSHVWEKLADKNAYIIPLFDDFKVNVLWPNNQTSLILFICNFFFIHYSHKKLTGVCLFCSLFY